jgi:putative transposase
VKENHRTKETGPSAGGQNKTGISRNQLREWMEGSEDFQEGLREVMRGFMEEILEAEMEQALGASKGERSETRRGYRSGYYSRGLVTRLGKIELRVPQDRNGLFSTEVFERYQRSEKALVASLVEMYVQGVSTRKVKKVTEELCGHGFSKSAVSRSVQALDEQLERFARRLLETEYPYVILDARYEKARDEGGVTRSQAVLVALGITWEGRREVLAVELAPKESAGHWREMLEGLQARGLRGVKLVISDDHSGLRKAIEESLTGVMWQRCYVHFLRNALDHLPRSADEGCLMQLRWIYEQGTIEAARLALGAWLRDWSEKYPKLCSWVEDNIEQTLTYLALPRTHHKHLKSTNMLERLNQELKRRTHIVRIFPNEASCLRLSRAVAAEIHDEWIEQHRYLDMRPLQDQFRRERTAGESTIERKSA